MKFKSGGKIERRKKKKSRQRWRERNKEKERERDAMEINPTKKDREN